MINRTRKILHAATMALGLFAMLAAQRGAAPNAMADDAVDVDLSKLRKVKSAYLLNFAKFIEWPAVVFENTDSPFQIGFIGNDPLGNVLEETVRGRTVGGRKLVVRRLDWAKPEDRKTAAECQIVYVGQWRDAHAGSVATAVESKSVLLVGEGMDFQSAGGAMGFSIEKGRVIFYVDRKALAKKSLKASSQLLKVARLLDSPDSQPGGS